MGKKKQKKAIKKLIKLGVIPSDSVNSSCCKNYKKGKSKQVVVGHKQKEVCNVIMQQRTVNQVAGYKTYIEFGGNIWQMNTTIPYTTGEFLSVNVDITPAE